MGCQSLVTFGEVTENTSLNEKKFKKRRSKTLPSDAGTGLKTCATKELLSLSASVVSSETNFLHFPPT